MVGPDVLCSHPPWWLTHITSTTASPTLLPRPDVALLCAAASKGKGQFSCFHDYLGPDLLTMLAPTHMADEWWDQLFHVLVLRAGSLLSLPLELALLCSPGKVAPGEYSPLSSFSPLPMPFFSGSVFWSRERELRRKPGSTRLQRRLPCFFLRGRYL